MITEGLKCARCMHELFKLDEFEFEGMGRETYLVCKHCGAKYEILEPTDEEKADMEFYQNNMPIDGRMTEPDMYNEHCINCGERVGISSNNMLSDFDDNIEDDDDDAMSFNLCTCEKCGITEVRWDTPESQKKLYPYWSEEEKESTED